MVFPATAIPLVAEWFINDAWTAIPTNDVLGEGRGGVVIVRGRMDETRSADASRCSFELRNTARKYSPRNPTGDFYGLFGRNTPVRFGWTADASWLQLDGPDHGSIGDPPAAGARVTAPDSAGLSIVGDLDLRFDADLCVWAPDPTEAMDLVGKWSSAGQRSYRLVLLPGGLLGFYWSTDGTAISAFSSTMPVPVSTGRLAVRATIDVDNGAAGHDVTFYTSDSITGSWVQLGDVKTGTGTTSIFNGTAAACVGPPAAGGQPDVIRGRVYAASILEGIGGTARGNPDFTAQTAGASSFADAAGNTWTLTGGVSLEDVDLRFTGEVPRWSPRLDKSGNDAWVPVDAFGVLQRIGQPDTVLDSPFRRGAVALDSVVAYWPLEDGDSSTVFASGLSNGKIMTWTGTPDLAADDRFVCSAPLPSLSGAAYSGAVKPYTETGAITLQFLMNMPAGTTDDAVIAYLTCRESQFAIRYRTTGGGGLQLEWYDFDGTFINQTSIITFAVDDQPLWFQVTLEENGVDIDYALATLEPSATSGLASSGTISSLALGNAQSVRINPQGTITSADAIIGHIIVRADVATLDVGAQLDAYSGEAAGDRIKRLCAESGYQFTGYGNIADTAVMGPQGMASLITLLRECADTDVGILYEPPDRDGIAYRTRESLYTQTARLTLDYTAGDPNEYQPSEDDVTLTGFGNDVTVRRGGAGSPVDGSTSRAAPTDVPLSILPPPAGVGPGYATDTTVNVDLDTRLPDQAGWRVHLGTVDEPRIESLVVMLQRTSVFADDAARAVVRSLRVGDMVTVENPPLELGGPDDVRCLVQGWTETLSNKVHRFDFRVSPASPYDVLVWDGGTEHRYTSDGTVTTEALDTTETGIDVSTPAGPVWTFDDGAFDVMIGGERITVGGVSGTGAAQTFTSCTRSVNGVVKEHDTGAVVELFHVKYWGL